MTSRRRIIGVDLDGVIIDHTTHFMRECKKHGYKLKPWQVNSNILGGIVPKQVHGKVKDTIYVQLRDSAAIITGALNALRKLTFNVVIVSVQLITTEKKAWRWLKRHGVLDIIPPSRIHMVRTRKAKIRRIKRLEPDVFIDDGLDILKYLPKKTLPLLFDPNHARSHIRVPKRIIPVATWPEALARIMENSHVK